MLACWVLSERVLIGLQRSTGETVPPLLGAELKLVVGPKTRLYVVMWFHPRRAQVMFGLDRSSGVLTPENLPQEHCQTSDEGSSQVGSTDAHDATNGKVAPEEAHPAAWMAFAQVHGPTFELQLIAVETCIRGCSCFEVVQTGPSKNIQGQLDFSVLAAVAVTHTHTHNALTASETDKGCCNDRDEENLRKATDAMRHACVPEIQVRATAKRRHQLTPQALLTSKRNLHATWCRSQDTRDTTAELHMDFESALVLYYYGGAPSSACTRKTIVWSHGMASRKRHLTRADLNDALCELGHEESTRH